MNKDNYKRELCSESPGKPKCIFAIFNGVKKSWVCVALDTTAGSYDGRITRYMDNKIKPSWCPLD